MPEPRTDDATLEGMSFGALLDAVAARQPTPGGGAVASVTAGLGAALGLMVVAYSEGRKKLAEHAELHADARARLEALRRAAPALAEADAAAYGRLNALWKLDADDERRRRDMPAAVRAAIDAPARILDLAESALHLFERLGGRTNRMLASDLAIAAILAHAAARAAAWNIRINLPLLDDADEAARLAEALDARLDVLADVTAGIEAACR